MNDIIERIQQDILNPTASIGNILLKAKVLAHQLKNESFKKWVKYELDGYPDALKLPDYRLISAPLLATIMDAYGGARNMPISLSECPKDFQELVGPIRFTAGIRTAEELAQSSENHVSRWQRDWINFWNHCNAPKLEGFVAVEVKRPVTSQAFAQISDTVRSRLQDFILELSDPPWDMSEQPMPPDQIERLVSVTIYNNNEGALVSTFDQRNQQVQNQNNAARDINISGGINNSAELFQAVRGLRNSLEEVEKDKQEEAISAIEILEDATQNDSARKSDIRVVPQ